jgi:hypothetical protein
VLKKMNENKLCGMPSVVDHQNQIEHLVKYDTKEVWVICESAITAMGVGALVKKYYPGYTGKIVSRQYLGGS